MDAKGLFTDIVSTGSLSSYIHIVLNAMDY